MARLYQSKGYQSHMNNWFCNHLRLNEVKLQGGYFSSNTPLINWTRQSVRENKSWKAMTVELLSSRGNGFSTSDGGKAWTMLSGKDGSSVFSFRSCVRPVPDSEQVIVVGPDGLTRRREDLDSIRRSGIPHLQCWWRRDLGSRKRRPNRTAQVISSIYCNSTRKRP